MHSNLMSQNS